MIAFLAMSLLAQFPCSEAEVERMFSMEGNQVKSNMQNELLAAEMTINFHVKQRQKLQKQSDDRRTAAVARATDADARASSSASASAAAVQTPSVDSAHASENSASPTPRTGNENQQQHVMDETPRRQRTDECDDDVVVDCVLTPRVKLLLQAACIPPLRSVADADAQKQVALLEIAVERHTHDIFLMIWTSAIEVEERSNQDAATARNTRGFCYGTEKNATALCHEQFHNHDENLDCDRINCRSSVCNNFILRQCSGLAALAWDSRKQDGSWMCTVRKEKAQTNKDMRQLL